MNREIVSQRIPKRKFFKREQDEEEFIKRFELAEQVNNPFA